MSQLNVGYGVLDMRVGQGLDWVAMQLEKSYKERKNYAAWYFDIIHTPNQTPKALEVLIYVKDMVQHASNLLGQDVVVRLNTNDKKLRARNMLFKRAHEANVEVVEQKVIE